MAKIAKKTKEVEEKTKIKVSAKSNIEKTDLIKKVPSKITKTKKKAGSTSKKSLESPSKGKTVKSLTVIESVPKDNLKNIEVPVLQVKKSEPSPKKSTKTSKEEKNKTAEEKQRDSKFSPQAEKYNSPKEGKVLKIKGEKGKKNEDLPSCDITPSKKSGEGDTKSEPVSSVGKKDKNVKQLEKNKDLNKNKPAVKKLFKKTEKVKLLEKVKSYGKPGKKAQTSTKKDEDKQNIDKLGESTSSKIMDKPRPLRNRGKTKKSLTDVYKSRHNIGKRVAAGRVCSYKETEISLVFPDDYWTVPSCKVDIALSSSGSSNDNSLSCSKSGDSDGSDDDEVQFNFEAQKRRAEKPEKKKNPKSNSKSDIKKTVVVKSLGSRSPSPSSIKNTAKKPYKSKKLDKNDSSSKQFSKNIKIKSLKPFNKGKKIKRKSKFEDIQPRAPRIQRTACLNASAINSLMYDYSAPPKRLKMDEKLVKDIAAIASDFDTETTMDEYEGSDETASDYEDEEKNKTPVKKVTQQKKVKMKEKKSNKPDKKLRSQLKAKRLLAKSKKKAMKRKNQEMLEKLMQPLPKRMASLNAQAIMTACKELDEMKIPPEPKVIKEGKKEKTKAKKAGNDQEDMPPNEDELTGNTLKIEETENSSTTLLKSPLKYGRPPNKQGKSLNKKPDSEEFTRYTEMRIVSNTSSFPESHSTTPGNSFNIAGQLSVNNDIHSVSQSSDPSNMKDPYEFVDVVDDDSNMMASRPLMTSQHTLKVQVASPEIIVDSPANSPPKTISAHPPQGFQPVRPAMPTPKPTPQYPPNVPYHMQQSHQPQSGLTHIQQAPFPHGGFRPSFNQHQLQGQPATHHHHSMSSSSPPSVPTHLPHSSTQSPFQQPNASQAAYTAASSSTMASQHHLQAQQSATSGFQATNVGAFGPSHPPVQLVPAYPPSSGGGFPSQPQQQQQQQQQLPVNHPSPVPSSMKIPAQAGSIGAPSPAAHTPGMPQQQNQRETSTSSGRSSVSSLTDQATPPSSGFNHQTHRATPLGNASTYPYSHGHSNPQAAVHPAVTVSNSSGTHCHQPYMQHSAGLGRMDGHPSGYPLMAYPRHYGSYPAAMFGGYPAGQQNSSALQVGQGRPGSGSVSSSGTASGVPHSQAQNTGPQNLYMGYGYYQPAGPLLQTGTNPFHMLQQQHMKGLFNPTMAHSKSPFVPQEMIMFPGKPAFHDPPAVMKSPLKRAGGKSHSSTPEKSVVKAKIDVLDLSVEHKTLVAIPKTVANLQKSEMKNKKGVMASDSSSGEEQASPEKQTKDILDLDSKKVRKHRGVVGETDRNSPLKVPKAFVSKKAKTDRGAGFPVQTYKFEAHLPRVTDLNQPAPNFMNVTTIEGTFHPVTMQPNGNMKTTVHLKHAETKTVAANVAIPFYSKPLSVQTSAAGSNNAETRMLLGKDITCNMTPVPNTPEKAPAVENKNKSSQNNISGPMQQRKGISDNLVEQQSQKRDSSNTVINLQGNQMMMKPVMPVLPLPSVAQSYNPASQPHQQQRAVVPPMTIGIQMGGFLTTPVNTDKSSSQSSSTVKSMVNPAAIIKPKGEKTAKIADKQQKEVLQSSIPSAPILLQSDMLKKSMKEKDEGALKSAVKNMGYAVNVSNCARGNEGKKLAKKESHKGDAKPQKKDIGKSRDSPKSSASRPDSLKVKAASTSKSKVESPRQKAKSFEKQKTHESPKSRPLESPKHQKLLLDSPKQKMHESPKSRPLESPKHQKQLLESPKQKTQDNPKSSRPLESPKHQKHLLDSPKQKTHETAKSRPLDSPKYQKHLQDTPKQKTHESPKSKPFESPKHQRHILDSPKQKSESSKVKVESPRQSRPETKYIKPDSPRQKNESRTKLELGSRFKFETPSKRREESWTGKPTGNSSGKKERRRSIEEKKLSPGSISRRRIQSAPPVIHSGWKWEGQAEFKLISCPGEAAVLRKCYPAVRHNDGDLVSVRDCVLVKSGPRKKDIPFVAKVAALWELAPYGEMMMSVLWYYRPEQTEMERLPRRERCEIFASRHRDIIPVACIDDKAYVLTFNEYCRFKSEQRRVAENGQSRPAIIPKPSDGASVLPPLDAPPETVFLCRRVYDVKLKRMLKNPQANYMYSSPNSSKSHTPTPSSKSPSPKSASPVVPKHQQQVPGSAEHNMDIIQAITTLAQLTNNLGSANMDLSLSFGLPLSSSIDMMSSSHQDVVSSSSSNIVTSSIAVDTPSTKSKFLVFSGASTNQSRELKFMPHTEPRQAFQLQHSLPQDKVNSSKSSSVLPIKSDLSIEDKKPDVLLPQFAFAAQEKSAAVDVQLDSKSSLSLSRTIDAQLSKASDSQEEKIEVAETSRRIDKQVFIKDSQAVTKNLNNVKSELITFDSTDSLQKSCETSKTFVEQKPLECNVASGSVNTASVGVEQQSTNNAINLHTENEREKLLQQAVRELTGSAMINIETTSCKEKVVVNPNESSMDIDEDDMSGELVMDLDSDSDSEVENDRSGMSPIASSTSFQAATPINIVHSNAKESLSTPPCKVGSSSDISDAISPVKPLLIEVDTSDQTDAKYIESSVIANVTAVNDNENLQKIDNNKIVTADSSDTGLGKINESNLVVSSDESYSIKDTKQQTLSDKVMEVSVENEINNQSVETTNSVIPERDTNNDDDNVTSSDMLETKSSDEVETTRCKENKETEVVIEKRSIPEASSSNLPEISSGGEVTYSDSSDIVQTTTVTTNESSYSKVVPVQPAENVIQSSKTSESDEKISDSKGTIKGTIDAISVQSMSITGVKICESNSVKSLDDSNIPIQDVTSSGAKNCSEKESSLKISMSSATVSGLEKESSLEIITTDCGVDSHQPPCEKMEVSIEDQQSSEENDSKKSVCIPCSSATEIVATSEPSGNQNKEPLKENQDQQSSEENNSKKSVSIPCSSDSEIVTTNETSGDQNKEPLKENQDQQKSEENDSKKSVSILCSSATEVVTTNEPSGDQNKDPLKESLTDSGNVSLQQFSSVADCPATPSTSIPISATDDILSKVEEEQKENKDMDVALSKVEENQKENKDVEVANSNSSPAAPCLLILEQMSEEMTKELNTGKANAETVCVDSSVTGEKDEEMKEGPLIVSDDKQSESSSSKMSKDGDDKKMIVQSDGQANVDTSQKNTEAENPEKRVQVNKSPKGESFLEENSNDMSVRSEDSEALTSESSTEVPGDTSNIGEIIGAEISFGSPSGDDNNIPLQIFSNEASPNLTSDLSFIKTGSVQVDNVSTTLPNLATQDKKVEREVDSSSVSSSVKVDSKENNEITEDVKATKSASKSPGKEKVCSTDSTVSSSALNTQKDNHTTVPIESKKDAGNVGNKCIISSSTSSISVSPVASRMITSGLKSPNASGSGLSRIEQIVSQIKMAGLAGAVTSTASCSTSSDSVSLNKPVDSSGNVIKSDTTADMTGKFVESPSDKGDSGACVKISESHKQENK